MVLFTVGVVVAKVTIKVSVVMDTLRMLKCHR